MKKLLKKTHIGWKTSLIILKQGMCKEAIEKVPRMLECVPDHLKTQAMCENAVEDEPDNLEFAPDNLRPKQCVKEPLKNFQGPWNLSLITLKYEEICERVTEKYPSWFIYVPDQLKTQEMCS